MNHKYVERPKEYLTRSLEKLLMTALKLLGFQVTLIFMAYILIKVKEENQWSKFYGIHCTQKYITSSLTDAALYGDSFNLLM